MTCQFCNKYMEVDETGIMCIPCEKGGHIRCYAQRGHGNHSLLGKNSVNRITDAYTRAACYSRFERT